MRYYVRRDVNAEIQGPFTVEELLSAIDAGTMSDNWLVSSDIGQPVSQLRKHRKRDWFRLSTIPNLRPKEDPLPPIDLNDKPCRNCGSEEVFSKDVSANCGHGPIMLPLGFFSAADFRLRVCGCCGLVEWFVSPNDLDKVKEKFL